jgi:hypothetical protein
MQAIGGLLRLVGEWRADTLANAPCTHPPVETGLLLVCCVCAGGVIRESQKAIA